MATQTAARKITDLSDSDVTAMISQAFGGKPTEFSPADLWVEQQKRQESALAAARASGSKTGPMKWGYPKAKTEKPDEYNGNISVGPVPGAPVRMAQKMAFYPQGLVALAENIAGGLEFIRDNKAVLSWGNGLPVGTGFESYLPRIESVLAKLNK